jgi:hypothetical protein
MIGDREVVCAIGDTDAPLDAIRRYGNEPVLMPEAVSGRGLDVQLQDAEWLSTTAISKPSLRVRALLEVKFCSFLLGTAVWWVLGTMPDIDRWAD